MAFSFNRGPLVAFRVDQAQRTAISIELAGITSSIKDEGKPCALDHSYQKALLLFEQFSPHLHLRFHLYLPLIIDHSSQPE